MVGKIKEGKTFGGCIAYNLDREKAQILYAEGVRTDDSKTITQDFNAQRKMNPNLSKAVGHMILSWSEKDRRLINPDTMLKDALEYLDRMYIRDTQRLIVLHTDRAHLHLHIVYNRVNNQGKTIGNSNLWKRNLQVTQAITNERGYHPAIGKTNVNRGRLKGRDKIKYEIYDAVKSALKTADGWDSLKNQLRYRGIGIQFKTSRGSEEIQGVSFSKNGVLLKGSQVDRSFSYGNLDRTLSGNSQQLQIPEIRNASSGSINKSQESQQPAVEIKNNNQIELVNKVDSGLLKILMDPSVNIQPDIDDEFMKRKRKRRKQKRKL
ncbi:MAG: relaxase/mobilization nuclease domain-containing protein [Sphingobacterium sp.]